MARMFLHGCPVAVWLERDVPPGEPVRIGRGPDIVTLSGAPSLSCCSTCSAARLPRRSRSIGEPAAISVLEHRKFGV